MKRTVARAGCRFAVAWALLVAGAACQETATTPRSRPVPPQGDTRTPGDEGPPIETCGADYLTRCMGSDLQRCREIDGALQWVPVRSCEEGCEVRDSGASCSESAGLFEDCAINSDCQHEVDCIHMSTRNTELGVSLCLQVCEDDSDCYDAAGRSGTCVADLVDRTDRTKKTCFYDTASIPDPCLLNGKICEEGAECTSMGNGTWGCRKACTTDSECDPDQCLPGGAWQYVIVESQVITCEATLVPDICEGADLCISDPATGEPLCMEHHGQCASTPLPLHLSVAALTSATSCNRPEASASCAVDPSGLTTPRCAQTSVLEDERDDGELIPCELEASNGDAVCDYARGFRCAPSEVDLDGDSVADPICRRTLSGCFNFCHTSDPHEDLPCPAGQACTTAPEISEWVSLVPMKPCEEASECPAEYSCVPHVFASICARPPRLEFRSF